MNKAELRLIWEKEEKAAHIIGWDFSHIHGRYEEEDDLPWDYEKTVRKYLNRDFDMLDYDTGGGEFLLSLDHPFDKTAATEGFKPNVRVCEEKLLTRSVKNWKKSMARPPPSWSSTSTGASGTRTASATTPRARGRSGTTALSPVAERWRASSRRCVA